MRLEKYLSYCPIDEKINKFRALTIQIVSAPTTYKEVVSELIEKYSLPTLDNTLKKLNHELRKNYKGNYFFDYCIDEGISFNKLNLKYNNYQKIKLLQLEINDVLTSHKKSIEISLQPAKNMI